MSWPLIAVGYFSFGIIAVYLAAFGQAAFKYRRARANGWGQFMEWSDVASRLNTDQGSLIVLYSVSPSTWFYWTPETVNDVEVAKEIAYAKSGAYVTFPPLLHYCSRRFLRMNFRNARIFFVR